MKTTSVKDPLTVLCLGAHCDDIEIGCGGTLLRFLESGHQVLFHWIVLCSTESRRTEALGSARAFLGDAATQVDIRAFQDGFLPAQWREVKEYFEDLKSVVHPDLILTPYSRDLHQDHRAVSELTWNTFRNHTILEYEIPKYDGDLGTPNVFVPLTNAQVSRKCQLITQRFKSQSERSWFSEDTFRALAKLRGIECNAPNGFAEAFYGRKVVIAI